MPYLNEFKEALRRNTRLELESPYFLYEDTRYLDDDFNAQFPYLTLNTFGMLEPKDLTARCIPIHNELQTVLKEQMGILSYFTIGSVMLEGKEVYCQTEDSLKRFLSEGIDFYSANLHAWLTLPTMEIIDMTFSTSYGVINNKKELLGQVITKN